MFYNIRHSPIELVQTAVDFIFYVQKFYNTIAVLTQWDKMLLV